MSKGPDAQHPLTRLVRKTQPGEGGCILWTGVASSAGYGTISTKSSDDFDKVNEYVHRVMYHYAVGPIPPDLQVDHVCGVRHCVNPDHLEAVTRSENMKRAWARKKDQEASE